LAEPLDLIRAGGLGGVPHGFFGRRGGVSRGVVAGLNAGLGAGDDPADVAVNRRRAADAVLDGAPLVSVHQVHSPDCMIVDAPWDDTSRPHADALATRLPGIVLGIVTADCAPVLFADAEAGVVGAAHAGWKGAFHGVIANTVTAMVALGARREKIAAAIGPCIAQASYEVDVAFRARFLEADPANARHFADGRAGHCQFDLEGYVAACLASAGLTRIERLGLDTYADPQRFYSYRRATHRGEPAYGRQIALVGLGPEFAPGA
jgi:YfiH family protein